MGVKDEETDPKTPRQVVYAFYCPGVEALPSRSPPPSDCINPLSQKGSASHVYLYIRTTTNSRYSVKQLERTRELSGGRSRSPDRVKGCSDYRAHKRRKTKNKMSPPPRDEDESEVFSIRGSCPADYSTSPRRASSIGALRSRAREDVEEAKRRRRR